MKIYTTYSNSHKVFLPWFNTIKEVEPKLTPVYIETDQICESGVFNATNWNAATRQKIHTLLEISHSTNDDYFIFSDPDIQFFEPIWDFGSKALEHHDIAFQNDYLSGQCTGFFYCRNNKKTKQLFLEALKVHHQYRDDQESIQAALNLTPELKHAFLPKEYFTYGMFQNDLWHNECEFKLPANIVMHHANWTVGIENKLELLKAVRRNYEQGNFKK
jgi:hypothetical protein